MHLSKNWCNADLSHNFQVCLTPDKLDSILYSEKYSVTLGANGNGFGGSFLDGAIVVTATGLLATVISSPDDPGRAITAIEKISAVRNRVLFADLAYAKGLLVFYIDGLVNCIRSPNLEFFFRV